MRILFPLLLPLALAVPASGQTLKGHNAKADVFFEADRILALERESRVIVSGNAQVTQADLAVYAPSITLVYSRTAVKGTNILRVDAVGGVRVVRSNESARGDTAIYDVPGGLITLIGSVTLNQNGNIVNSARLVIDLKSNQASFSGKNSGVNNRVTGRFRVSN